MGWFRKRQDTKEQERNRKITESQHALLNAAIATADMAQEVTTGLKKRLDDIVRQFESTARILRDGLVICTEAGIITTFNPAAERIFGIKAGAAIRQSVLRFFDGAEEPIADAGALWTRLQEPMGVLGVRDGTTFPVKVTLSSLDRHDGSRVMLLLVHDRCDDPAQGERRYRNIFEAAHDGIAVVVTQDGSFAAVNPSIPKMFGYTNDELMQTSLLELVVPRDRELLKRCCGPDGVELPQHFSIEGVHSSGRPLSLIFALTDIQWDGRPAALATIKDVTEMRRVESALAVKRDNGVDLVVGFDPTYRITFANDTFARFVKHERQALVGVDIRALMDDGDTAAFLASMSSLTPETPVVRSQSRDGGMILDWVDHALFDDSGRPLEFLRVGRDFPAA